MICGACKFKDGDEINKYKENFQQIKGGFFLAGGDYEADTETTIYVCPKCGTIRCNHWKFDNFESENFESEES